MKISNIDENIEAFGDETKTSLLQYLRENNIEWIKLNSRFKIKGKIAKWLDGSWKLIGANPKCPNLFIIEKISKKSVISNIYFTILNSMLNDGSLTML